MATALLPRLVNEPHGDPGLFVDLVGHARAFLFDAGRCDRLSPAEALRVTDVFVSHAHIDHWIGFDGLLRWHLGRPSLLRVHGPPGTGDRVAGRLQGYTWNLVDDQTLVVEAVDLDLDGAPARVRRFACGQAFAEVPPAGPPGAVPLDAPPFRVTAALCDHRVPCAAWRLDESPRWHVRADRLPRLGLEVGPWVGGLKAAAASGATPEVLIPTPLGPRALRDFLAAAVVESDPGHSVGYVTDVAWHDANVARLTRLLSGVEVLFCEGGFLARDEARARAVAHLTARDAGRLARACGAGTLHTFHFSPRYHPDFEPLRLEAAAAFAGAP